MVKMGGFVIFSTKLNLKGENQYENTIQEICDSHHWKFVTEHTFYRYEPRMMNAKFRGAPS